MQIFVLYWAVFLRLEAPSLYIYEVKLVGFLEQGRGDIGLRISFVIRCDEKALGATGVYFFFYGQRVDWRSVDTYSRNGRRNGRGGSLLMSDDPKDGGGVD